MSQFYPYQLFQDMADAYVGSLPRLVFIQGHESEINKLNSNASFPIMFLCEDVNLLTIRNIRQGLQEVRFRMYLLRQSPAQGQGLGKPQSNVQNDRVAFTDYHGNMQDVADQMISYLRFKRPDLSSQIQWETKPLKAQSTAFLTGVQVDCTLVMRDAYCQEDFVPAERAQPVTFLNRAGTYAGFVPIELESNFDATIYYTTDGSIPTPQNGTVYDPDNIEFLTDTRQVRAIAFVDGLLPSVITSASYIITPIVVFAQPQGGLYLQGQLAPIALGSNSQSTVIRFTLDGSTPTESSPIFTGALSVNENTTLKFIGFDPPALPSAVVTEVYQIKALAPRASVSSGTFIEGVFVELFNDNPIGTIQYRINGGEWQSDTEFSADVTAVYEVRVIDPNYVTSDILTLNIEIQSIQPTIVPNGGVFENSQEITLIKNSSSLSTQTRYTTDGSDPIESSTLYTAPFTITATSEVKAKNFRAGTTPSDVTEAQFNKIFKGAVAGAFNGRIYITENSFVTWNELNVLGLSNQTWVSANLGENGSFAQVYTADSIRYSTDLLTTWQTPTLPSALVSVFRNTADKSGQKVAIVANIGNGRNQVLVSLDGGATFVDRSPNLATFFDVAYSPDGTRLYCSKTANNNVNEDVIYFSDDDGLTWTATYNENNRNIENLVATDNAIYFNIFNATTSAYIGFHRSTDNGVTRVLRSGAGTNYRRTWISGDDSLIVSAQTSASNILRISTDQGATWSNFTLPASVTVIRLNPSYDAVRWIFGTTTRLYVSLNSMGSVNETQPAGNVDRTWQLGATLS
jgi:hypothetical protein